MPLKIALYGDSLTRGLPGAAYIDELRQRNPQHTYLNYGKGSDTVRSLLRRVVHQRLAHPVDAAGLWIGVKDAPWPRPPLSPLLKVVSNQTWARSHDEYRPDYRATLELLAPHTPCLTAIAPVCTG